MALTELTKDMAVIQKLEDEPNDVGGLTAAQLKAKFDEAGEAIKAFLNESLLPELGADSAAGQLGAVMNGEKTNVQDALDLLQRAVIQSGNVPTGGKEGEYLRKKSDGLYDLEWTPPFTAFSFTAADWTAEETGAESTGTTGDGTEDAGTSQAVLYTITVPQTVHRRQSGAFSCALRHSVNGVLLSNTWAVFGTQTAYDSATGDITLTSTDAYDGAAIFCG